ncbi:MAG TPA: MBL fold metallo-hydrolase [Cyclobacteriaceae bacterium]|nr:MBL fold metallo-hydrolase [Cyclobacteriaceae bacterium]
MRRLAIIIILVTGAFGIRAQIKENSNYVDSLSLKIGDIKEEVIKIQDNFYVIIPYGIAGNIGVYISDNGVILVDDQWAVLSKRIRELISAITREPIKTIINTHYHFDHTNGNLAFGPEKIPIISHKNARTRMSERQVMPTYYNVVQNPYPPESLPTTTFTDKLEFNEKNETIELVYYKSAHTDGDIIVHFKNADIYHTGDIFVTYGLPHIDEAAGGDIYGIIEAVENLLSQASDKTRFIPGHGPVCTKKELQEYRDLLVTVRDNVVKLYREKRILGDIIKDTQIKIHYENKGGEKFIEQVYRTVEKHELQNMLEKK